MRACQLTKTNIPQKTLVIVLFCCYKTFGRKVLYEKLILVTLSKLIVNYFENYVDDINVFYSTGDTCSLFTCLLLIFNASLVPSKMESLSLCPSIQVSLFLTLYRIHLMCKKARSGWRDKNASSCCHSRSP